MSAASLGDVGELLKALSGAFAERRLRWYVFGAQAVVAHGRPRLTADVDAAVELAGETAAALANYLEGHAFALRFPLAEDRAATARLLPMVHVATGVPLDLVLTAPGLEEEFLERARLVNVGGAEVPIVSAEDLIAMKLLAGRRKDLEDVRGVLLEQWDVLDVARIRDVVRAFQQATGDARLERRLDRQLRAARSVAPARGTPSKR